MKNLLQVNGLQNIITRCRSLDMCTVEFTSFYQTFVTSLCKTSHLHLCLKTVRPYFFIVLAGLHRQFDVVYKSDAGDPR